MNVTRCKACRAPIVWAVTPNGARQPLDSEPAKRVVLDIGVEPPLARVVDTYMPHHATCPKVAQFRKPKEGANAR